MATVDENKDLIRRYYEETEKTKDAGLVDEYCTEDYVNHTAPPGFGSDRQAAKRLYAMYFNALPDFRTTIEDVLGEDDRVALRWTIHGTHRGEMMGIPATGEQVEITGIYLARLVDGRIAESWERTDLLGLMQQLGVAPAPEDASAHAAPGSAQEDRDIDPGASAELTREVYEEFDRRIYNEHDLDAVDELVTEGFRHHAPIPTAPGRDGYRTFLADFYEAFPDATSETEDTVVDGDRIAVRYTARATHEGEFAGVPATSRQVEVPGISIYRVNAAGRITDEWAQPDLLGLMQQLGVIDPG